MINVNKGRVELKGDLTTICTEMSIAVRGLCQLIKDNYEVSDVEILEDLVTDIVETGIEFFKGDDDEEEEETEDVSLEEVMDALDSIKKALSKRHAD